MSALSLIALQSFLVYKSFANVSELLFQLSIPNLRIYKGQMLSPEGKVIAALEALQLNILQLKRQLCCLPFAITATLSKSCNMICLRRQRKIYRQNLLSNVDFVCLCTSIKNGQVMRNYERIFSIEEFHASVKYLFRIISSIFTTTLAHLLCILIITYKILVMSQRTGSCKHIQCFSHYLYRLMNFLNTQQRIFYAKNVQS